MASSGLTGRYRSTETSSASGSPARATAPDVSAHYTVSEARPFTRAERDRVTILISAVTGYHNRLIEAAMGGLGYRLKALPVPTKADFQTGKEFGNNGMCNPAYFTGGALVNHLRRLRDYEGETTDAIIRNHVFVTAGSCGPCRFGMYAEEMRLMLRNSGFEGFRVVTFQQKGGLSQSGTGGGIEFDAAFALALLKSLALGDLLNELACQMRPYEVVPGTTDRVLNEVGERIAQTLAQPRRPGWGCRLAARVFGRLVPEIPPPQLALVIDEVVNDSLSPLLRACAAEIDRQVEVDFVRPKPICKLTGEFFAQMTEGDGNFGMVRFLEANGAEVLPEPITTWVGYLVSSQLFHLADRKGLADPDSGVAARGMRYWKRRLKLRLAGVIVNRGYERMRRALGGTAHPQVSQVHLAELAHGYYNRKCAGGEGHLEVAKTLYYAQNGLAHMVLSLKPFGCLPSTQSDGAQAAVTGHNPDVVFLPIETSGEGDVNAQSRVLMALGDARERCEEEFERVVRESQTTAAAVRAYCRAHRDLRRPLRRARRQRGVVGRGANFVLQVADEMSETDRERTR